MLAQPWFCCATLLSFEWTWEDCMVHAPQFLKLVQETRPRVKETNVPDVKRRIDAGEKMLFVDVREDHEWTKGHLPGAVHMGRAVTERQTDQKTPDTETTLLLYSGGGYRSVLLADNLQKMDHTKVESK